MKDDESITQGACCKIADSHHLLKSWENPRQILGNWCLFQWGFRLGNSPGQFAVRPSTDSVHHRFSVTHLPTKKNMAGSKCYFTRNNHRKLVCFNMEGTTESHGISRSTMVNHHRQVFSGPALRQDIFGEPPDGGLWRRSPFKWCPVTQYVS